ncbi:LysR family transcriptional regulator [Verticiella sediminum]|uniref:LysR family transcriptional regulator n=1 Tax=Verticiella sediminum TaxID=1247510 RepID=A0A556AJM5_9BURK|nr:LysR family transcriptional regulator [Verticiella sediminum]TSH93081.1 LysR family transcriptional regulator [Verticiella sediminum]
MEFRQIRYFVRAVELGSMGRAAVELDIGTSALSQQISRLEGELCTRLLQRTATGVVPTNAGLAFFRQAQLVMRHAEHAVEAARSGRVSGHVSVGMAPSTAAVLGVPFLRAMLERYPEARLRVVEALSIPLTAMLHARQIDLAILFGRERAPPYWAQPLLDERLYLVGNPSLPHMPRRGESVTLAEISDVPLVLPSAPHGLRALINTAFERVGVEPRVIAEIDGFSMLMDTVTAGIAATVQPGAVLARPGAQAQQRWPIADAHAHRRNLIASLSDDELSPVGLAARVVLTATANSLVAAGQWPGATLHRN